MEQSWCVASSGTDGVHIALTSSQSTTNGIKPSWNDGFLTTASLKFLLDIKSQCTTNTHSIGIPYPTPADRRDVENIVKSNWDTKVQKPLGSAANQVTDDLHQAKEWVFDT